MLWWQILLIVLASVFVLLILLLIMCAMILSSSIERADEQRIMLDSSDNCDEFSKEDNNETKNGDM